MPQETRVWHLSTTLLRVWFACDIHYNESLLHDDICKLFRRLNLPVSLRFWWEWNFSGTQLTVLHRWKATQRCVCVRCACAYVSWGWSTSYHDIRTSTYAQFQARDQEFVVSKFGDATTLGIYQIYYLKLYKTNGCILGSLAGTISTNNCTRRQMK